VPAGPQPRRHDIDWLRIGAPFLLFPFHSARPFDHQPWHVKSPDASTGFDLFVWLIHQFHMPLFFTLAGWSLERALHVRTEAEVRRERYARLLVPFLVGVALLSPPQAYLEAITQKGFTGNFRRFLPHFFTSLEYFSWHHLWFLIYLFTFTMLYRPLLARLERSDVHVATVRPRVLYASIVPFAAVQLALRWRWPGLQNLYDDWANFLWYSLFFVGGFLIARFPAVDELILVERRRCARVFVLAVLGMLPLLARLDGRIAEPGLGYILYWPLSATAGVCGVTAVLGYGRRLETVGGAWFSYLRESALPVYVLHQAVIVVLAYWLVHLPLPLLARWAILMVAGLATTLAIYHELVRPIPVMRAAFGLRARQSRAEPAAVARGESWSARRVREDAPP
jgi:glucans biosynthesis protein C